MGAKKSKIFLGCFTGILSLLAVILAGWWAFSSQLGNYLTQNVIQTLRNRGVNVNLKVNQSSFAPFLSYAASDIDIFLSKALLQLHLDSFSASVSTLSLLSLNPMIYLQSELYKGRLNFSAHRATQNIYATLTLQNLQLNEHPQLNGLGIRKGDLNIEVKSFEALSDGSIKSAGTLNLKQVEIPQIPSYLIPFPMPGVNDLNLDSTFTIDSANSGSIKVSKLTSNYLTASGDIRLIFENRLISGSNGEFNVNFSDVGAKSLLPLIMAAQQSPYQEQQRNYDIRWTSEACGRSHNAKLLLNLKGFCVVFTVIPRS